MGGGCGGCVVAMNIYGDVPKFRTLSLSRIQYGLDAYACPPCERTLSCWSIIGIVLRVYLALIVTRYQPWKLFQRCFLN